MVSFLLCWRTAGGGREGKTGYLSFIIQLYMEIKDNVAII